MERLKNLSEINTNVIEGRLLIAAISKLSSENFDFSAGTVLEQVQNVAERIYKDAGDIPSGIEEPKTFVESLTTLINKNSLENGSNTPDFILANYLIGCLDNYNKTLTARDKWFGIDVWETATDISK